MKNQPNKASPLPLLNQFDGHECNKLLKKFYKSKNKKNFSNNYVSHLNLTVTHKDIDDFIDWKISPNLMAFFINYF